MKMLAALLLLFVGPAQADKLSLSWDHPMRDVVAYRVYCGTDPAVRAAAPPHVIDVTDTRAFRCAVTALDASGRESDRSVPTPEVRCVNGACAVPPACACLTVTQPTYVVAPSGTRATRPLYDRPGGARIGNVEIKMPDGAARACEGGIPLLTTTAGEWRYVTNDAGLRGVALCRRRA